MNSVRVEITPACFWGPLIYDVHQTPIQRPSKVVKCVIHLHQRSSHAQVKFRSLSNFSLPSEWPTTSKYAGTRTMDGHPGRLFPERMRLESETWKPMGTWNYHLFSHSTVKHVSGLQVNRGAGHWQRRLTFLCGGSGAKRTRARTMMRVRQ